MAEQQRTGVLVDRPYQRLTDDQIRLVDATSRKILEDPGLICYNEEAAGLLEDAGARVAKQAKYWKIQIPGRLIDQALETAPSTVVLGARDPDNRLILDAYEPRARFVSGAETNLWLEVDFAQVEEAGPDSPRLSPLFTRRPGSILALRRAAHLAEHLENLDAFIRCVNIQDPEVTSENKDVNKFFACFDNITKHVQGGLTSLEALDDVLRMAELVAGGPEAFQENPIISFIACLIKSPLQMVDDTTAKTIVFARRQIPIVISSSPMGGATASFDEFGMVAQINAEILAGMALTQLASPGAPLLYGSVPVRTRLDNLMGVSG